MTVERQEKWQEQVVHLRNSAELNRETLEGIVGDVARRYAVPFCMVTILDEKTQYVLAAHGTDLCETSREDSACKWTIQRDLPVIINDASNHPFKYSSLVASEPHLRFYAGAPLRFEPWGRLGALCILDIKPHPAFSLNNTDLLVDQAKRVVRLLETA